MKSPIAIPRFIQVMFLTIFFAGGLFARGPLAKNTVYTQNNLQINHIDLGMDNEGNIGLDGNTYYPNGSALSFLFSGGIGLSGYENSTLYASWAFTSSRLRYFRPGTAVVPEDDPHATIYTVNSADPPGNIEYQFWTNAVAVGAPFRDNDHDGSYSPNTDAPILLGDRLLWTTYTDSTINSFSEAPLGVDIQQTVWGFNKETESGDVLFFHYRLINSLGRDLKDVIFTVVEDPDIGNYNDDMSGCDSALNLGYAYNSGTDQQYGSTPPAFGMQVLQGPLAPQSGATAQYLNLTSGKWETIQDYENIPMLSHTVLFNSDPAYGDPQTPQEARYYQLGGLNKNGSPTNPETFPFGSGGSGTDDPRFTFSGDPVSGSGWIQSTPQDVRYMVSVGPFNLAPADTQDILIAMIVTQGASALDAVSQLKKIAQSLQDNPDGVITRLNAPQPLPGQFRLLDNYPNPFNPSTTLRYQLPREGFVRLTIWDTRGRLLDTLVEERQNAGEYHISYDASSLAAGVYFYRIEFNGEMRVAKMMLLR